MPVKLRLQRHGRKQRPFYHIVAADVRSPRDGKFIERVGWYDPTKSPALVDIDRDKALEWLMNGAQPTDSVRSILSSAGVLYRKHLMRGVRKGALNAEKAEDLFEKWLEKRAKSKDAKIVVITPYREIEPTLSPALQRVVDGFYPKPQEEEEIIIPVKKAEVKKEKPKADKPKPKPRSERRPKKTVEEKIEEANTKVQEELAAKGTVIEPLVAKPTVEEVAPATPTVEAAPKVEEAAKPVVEAAPKVEEVAKPAVEAAKPVVEAAPKVEETVGADTEAIDAIIDDSSSVLDEIDALLEKSSFNIDSLMGDASDKADEETK